MFFTRGFSFPSLQIQHTPTIPNSKVVPMQAAHILLGTNSFVASLLLGSSHFPFLLHGVNLFHAVDGMSKYSGASVMAKSLFESLQHSSPNKTLTLQQLTDEFVMDECNSSCKPGGHSNELHRVFSRQKHYRFNIGVHIF